MTRLLSMPRRSHSKQARVLPVAPPPNHKDKAIDLLRESRKLIAISHELIRKATAIAERVRQVSEALEARAAVNSSK